MSSQPSASITEVPAELLLKFFHAYVEPRQGAGHYHTQDADLRHRRSVILTHVCRTWRAIVLREPALWTDIRLTGVSKLDMLYFQRSRPLPVDLTISLTAMEAKAGGGGTCAELVGNRLLLQPKQDRARIRSIRATHYRDIDARNLISFVAGKLKLPTLSALFIKTTCPSPPPSNRLGRTSLLEPQRLLCSSLTTLEVHSRHQTLHGGVVKRALEVCRNLTTLVLGGLLLDGAYGGVAGHSHNNSASIHARSLKRLAVGGPFFTEDDDPGLCSTRCPCPFRNLVAENLEYLEVAGDMSGALDHLLPLIKKRTGEVGGNSMQKATLRLVMNSGLSASEYAYSGLRSLPHNVHLHVFNDQSFKSTPVVTVKNLPPWFLATKSTVLYIPVVSGDSEAAVRMGRRRFPSSRVLRRRSGSVAILVHPAADACRDLGETDLEARGWVLLEGEGKGPYLDPIQPITERPEPTYYDDGSDRDFNWQEYRDSLGWPEGYDTPSD